MAIEFRCDDCGKRLRARDDQEGSPARCPGCGTVTTVPSLPEAVDADAGLRRADDPSRKSAKGGTLEVCPECDEPMAAGAVICLECGFDRRTGKRRKTKVRRYERRWAPGMSLVGRIILLVCLLLVFNFFGVVLLLNDASLIVLLPILLVLDTVTILVVGWYDTLYLRREREGALLMTRRTYLCFAPVSTVTVDLADCEAVRIDAGAGGGTDSASPGLGGILSVLAAVILFGWIGGIIVARRGVGQQNANVSFSIRLLSRPRRKPVLTLYRGSDDEFMRDLVDELQKQGELEIVR